MNTTENLENSSSDEDILSTAKERFNLVVDSDSEFRSEAIDDLKFSAGEQWDPALKSKRDLENRPCLTINRLPQQIRQITNDQRQNRPSIRVSPVDDKADIETAKIYQGMIRHIENASSADTAYDTAFEAAVRAGRGFFRIITEYSDPHSFDLNLRLKRIRNPLSVYFDPFFQEPDGSDANFAFVVEDLSPDEFKAKYPDAELSKTSEWEAYGNTLPDWIKGDSVRVAEYFYKEFKDTTLYLIAHVDPMTQELMGKFTVSEEELDQPIDQLPPQFQIIDKRKTQIPIVKWVIINGLEILERTEFPSQFIPIIPVLGEELDIDGKRFLSGVVRYAKDSQRMYNVWASAEAETIALAPKAPFIGYAGQFEGFEDEWATANIRSHAYLEVNPLDINGNPAPLPQRNAYEAPVQAISQARMLASEDIKATTGIYDAALGNRSNETSGVAIRGRQIQAQTSNFHFMDNLARSLRHAGRILLEAIPVVYDVDRAIRIIGEDGEEEVIRINEEFERRGKKVRYDLGVGKYDITVSTGPSFESKRQEAVQAMLEFTRTMPQHAALVADLLVKNMDWPGAQEFADRLKKTLPPEMQNDGAKQEIPPEVQAQMAQMNQMLEAMTQQLNQAHDQLEKDSLKYDFEREKLAHDERLKAQELQVKLQIELAKIDQRDALELFHAEIQELQARMNQLGSIPQQEQTDLEGSGAGFGQGAATPYQQQLPTDGPYSSGQNVE